MQKTDDTHTALAPTEQAQIDAEHARNPLQDQLKEMIHLPDEKYSDKLLTSDMRKYIQSVEGEYVSSMANYKSHIAPSYWELQTSMVNVSGLFGKTYYAHNYPPYMEALWTRDML